MADEHVSRDRMDELDRTLSALLKSSTGVEAAAVVSFDGLPMASSLPLWMDEDRVAAMSAALLSLGERATEGLGRGALSEVFIEGENGTVCLLSCDDEAVLVAVSQKGAKTGLVLYEVRRSAAVVAGILRADQDIPAEPPEHHLAGVSAELPPATMPEPVPVTGSWDAPESTPNADRWPSYAPTGTVLPGEPSSWS